MTLAIFDFDGTITTKDSFIQFILFTHGELKTFFGTLALSPWIILYQLKKFPNWKLKEYTLTSFYHGMEEEVFKKLALDFALDKIPPMVRPSAMEKIRWHKSQGHQVVIVSASPENYLQLWCQANKLDLLATKLQIENGQITGLIDGKNCYGEEKVRRIKEKYNLADFEYIYAYGDSEGDKALQQVANEFHYKIFK